MRRRVYLFVFLVILGLFPLMNSLRNPRVQMLHGSDIVRLMAAGWCFGIGFGAIVGKRKFPGE